MTMKTITVTNYFGGCPTCGANDGCVNVNGMLRCYCKSHNVSWDISQDLSIHPLPKPGAEERERNKFIEDYEHVHPVPEGTWPEDPEVRRRESMNAWQKRCDEEQRQERLFIERCEKVSASVVDALTPFAAEMPSNEQIRVRVDPDTELILSAAGVRRQRAGDIPF
jgi:hypothetical protein